MASNVAEPAVQHELFDIIPLQPNIGAEIRGVDLTRPLQPAVRDALRSAWLKYRVIFFRDQDLTHEQHIALGRNFGELEANPVFSLPEYPEILPLLAENHIGNQRDNLNAAWHADTTMSKAPPAGAILRSRVVPPLGGDTLFSNVVLGYELLPEKVKQRIDGLTAIHDSSIYQAYAKGESYDKLKEQYPDVEHPVVRVHPETGEKAIFVNTIYTRRIASVDAEESEELLRILFDQVKQPELQVRFSWQPNSLAFWDNRSCQHYGVNDYVGERHVERVTISGDVPYGPGGA